MKNGSYGPASPQPTKQIDSSLFAINIHKSTDCFYDDYTPSTCEECGRPLTEHVRQEAQYADGQFLCGECRSDYMELHHSDPFFLSGGIAA